MDEDAIERKAIEEILLEANKSRHRADELGVAGWKRSRYVTNKRFLFNTLASAVGSRRSQVSLKKQSDNLSTSSATEICGRMRSDAIERDFHKLESDHQEKPDQSGDGKLLQTKSDSEPHKRKSDDNSKRGDCSKRYKGKERDTGNYASSRTSIEFPVRRTSMSDVYDVNDYIRLNRKAIKK